MIGAIVGDVIGSRFEFDNRRDKEFALFTPMCFATDDSIMTVAIMRALIMSDQSDFNDLGKKAVYYMRKIGRQYPDCGYGLRFNEWLYETEPRPYYSYGNGAAMRISPVAYVAKNEDQLRSMSRAVTAVTHNHPEGIKGALVTATCTWMALRGYRKSFIADYAKSNYDLSFSLEQLREEYTFNETCQETVPQAIFCFLESSDFEDAIRNAVSIGGDSDTVAAITGSIAGAYYGVPKYIEEQALERLPNRLRHIVLDFGWMYKVHTFI